MIAFASNESLNTLCCCPFFFSLSVNRLLSFSNIVVLPASYNRLMISYAMNLLPFEMILLRLNPLL